MAIGVAISLTAFTAFSSAWATSQYSGGIGCRFLNGGCLYINFRTGIRAWILRNLPASIAHGAGIGIGLFLLLIAANSVGLVVGNDAVYRLN